ncbi:hypothetical protein [Williamsia sterculiae]|uniref:hypothetical protein n=1 Tax=Williamsia sterculiae TaxID=1344003 RepID=UPI000970D0CB|nr:hypothetical protein [Williamsia sterculiae]
MAHPHSGATALACIDEVMAFARFCPALIDELNVIVESDDDAIAYPSTVSRSWCVARQRGHASHAVGSCCPLTGWAQRLYVGSFELTASVAAIR